MWIWVLRQRDIHLLLLFFIIEWRFLKATKRQWVNIALVLWDWLSSTAWIAGNCGHDSLVPAAINQEATVVSVVLYQGLCPDSSLVSLSGPAPRTWLSTQPDPPDNMLR